MNEADDESVADDSEIPPERRQLLHRRCKQRIGLSFDLALFKNRQR